MQRDRWGDIYANTPTKKMIALYDYDPMELSPNVDMEVIDDKKNYPLLWTKQVAHYFFKHPIFDI